jgi:putative thiazole-containing bacteriocin maturation protein
MEVTTEFRPKLKQDSIFLPNNDGVLFRNGGNVFFLKGASIYRWVSSLAPHLTGEHTLEELCRSLDPGRREMVVRLVHTLLEKGIVKDHVVEDLTTLPVAVRERFAPQIELIDHYAASPITRFKAFRQSRLLLAGSGVALRTLASSLARNGLETLFLAPTTGAEDLCRTVEEEVASLWGEGAGVLTSVERVSPTCLGSEIDLSRFDVVAYCSNDGSLHDAHLLNERCFRAGVEFLPGFVFGGRSYIGPLVRPGSEGCWQCALMRLSANLEEGEAGSLWKRVALRGRLADEPFAAFATTARMMANSLAFELFKARTGHQLPESQGGLLVQDLETLESARVNLLAHPLCEVCAVSDPDSEAARLEDLVGGRCDRKVTAEEQLQNWYRFIDPRAGFARSFADEEAEQIPLRTTLLVMGHPAEPAARPFRISAQSVESTAVARHQALLEAVNRYAQAVPDERRMVSGSYEELFESGKEPVAPDELSLWSGIQTFDRRAPSAWLPAYSTFSRRMRHVPAAAVYPQSALNRDTAFERAAAGQAVGLSYAEALTAGLLSALCFERLRDVLKGSAQIVSLDAETLRGDDADVSYLLKTLERLEGRVRLLELAGDVPVRVVLACTDAKEAGGEEVIRVGSSLARMDAVRQALVGVVGTLQDRAAGPWPDAPSYLSEVTFSRFSLPVDAAVKPLERTRYGETPADVEDVYRLLRGCGRDVLFVNTSPADVWSTGTFMTGTVLLTG